MREDLPTVRVEVGGVRKQILVDSGAQNSLIQPGVHGGIIVPSTSTTIGVTGNITRWRGVQELHFVLDGYVYKHTFGIMPLPPNVDGL
jgi:hypothetical protein